MALRTLFSCWKEVILSGFVGFLLPAQIASHSAGGKFNALFSPFPRMVHTFTLILTSLQRPPLWSLFFYFDFVRIYML